jgi:hypothetical protein
MFNYPFCGNSPALPYLTEDISLCDKGKGKFCIFCFSRQVFLDGGGVLSFVLRPLSFVLCPSFLVRGSWFLVLGSWPGRRVIAADLPAVLAHRRCRRSNEGRGTQHVRSGTTDHGQRTTDQESIQYPPPAQGHNATVATPPARFVQVKARGCPVGESPRACCDRGRKRSRWTAEARYRVAPHGLFAAGCFR